MVEGKASILIVDDHPILIDGLTQLLNQQRDLSVCGSARTAAEALAAIETLSPDLAILDISLQDGDGIELTKNIHARRHELPILILSMHNEAVYAERALRAGARGYVMKRGATGTVVSAIRRILSGEVYLSDSMQRRMLRSVLGGRGSKGTPIDTLSDRELEVLRLIGQGLATREIAGMLHLSPKTIESHREHLKEKLELEDSWQLHRYAIGWVRNECT